MACQCLPAHARPHRACRGRAESHLDMPCHAMPHLHCLLCTFMPCHATPCQFVLCHVWHCQWPCRGAAHPAQPRHVMSRHVMPCHTLHLHASVYLGRDGVPCHAWITPCRAMACNFDWVAVPMPCNGLSCYVLLPRVCFAMFQMLQGHERHAAALHHYSHARTCELAQPFQFSRLSVQRHERRAAAHHHHC